MSAGERSDHQGVRGEGADAEVVREPMEMMPTISNDHMA